MESPTIFALLAAVLPALAAEPKLQEIIDRNLQAIGGAEAHRKLKSSEVRGSVQMPNLGGPASITIVSLAPDKQRTTIESAAFGTIVEGFDGKTGWSKNPFTGLTEKSGEALEQARRQAHFHRDSELATRYAKLEYAGREELKGRPVHVLRGRYADGTPETLYLDAESHLVVQVKGRIAMPDGGADSRLELSDYRTVDGVKVPFSIRLLEPETAAFDATIKEVMHNVAVDEAGFKKPAE